jgi:hypothetical protein
VKRVAAGTVNATEKVPCEKNPDVVVVVATTVPPDGFVVFHLTCRVSADS